jgi:hypothetical protein
MNALPRTDIQRRLDDDFAAMFERPLPPIAAPLSPEEMAEGDIAQERC